MNVLPFESMLRTDTNVVLNLSRASMSVIAEIAEKHECSVDEVVAAAVEWAVNCDSSFDASASSPKPEPAVTVEPEPAVTAEPEPAVTAEPEPAVTAEPEPDNSTTSPVTNNNMDIDDSDMFDIEEDSGEPDSKWSDEELDAMPLDEFDIR